MDLRTYLRSLDDPGRENFAERCKTSVGHLRNVGYGIKTCATNLAVAIERESGFLVRRQELRADWADHWPELSELTTGE